MGLIHAPFTRTSDGEASLAGFTLRAMQVGQHVMAVLLTSIGSIRAIADGTPVATAAVAGLALLAWHSLGTIAGQAHRTPARAVWWLIGFTIVWGASVAVSAEFVWIAFLLWLLAGHLLPLGWALPFSGLVFAVVVIAPYLHHGATTYAMVFGPLIGGVFALGISRGYLQLLHDATERERLLQSLTQAQQEMAELQDELALAQRQSGAIAERTRIARDIHDTIAQTLSSVKLLAHASGVNTLDDGARTTFKQIETLAGESLADVRRIVAELAPAELENDALAAALKRMLDRLHDETGMTSHLHVDASLPVLPSDIEVALLRTAQSALANVRLHAQATQVNVHLIDAEDTVRLDIVDNGTGFDARAWEAASVPSGTASYGLTFMRTRLRELHGGLDIESTPGEGTALSAHIPLPGSRGYEQ